MGNVYSAYYFKTGGKVDFMPVQDAETWDTQFVGENYGRVSTFRCDCMEKVFHDCQAEIWQPTEQQIDNLRQMGVGHASMSVNDIVVDEATGTAYIVAMCGFTELPWVRGNSLVGMC